MMSVPDLSVARRVRVPPGRPSVRGPAPPPDGWPYDEQHPVGAWCAGRDVRGGILLPARSLTRIVALGAIAALSLTACATSSSGEGGGGGGDAPTDLVISSDLPLQGASASTSDSTNKLIQLYLDQVGGKAGRFNITFKPYDDSTAAKGAWDDAACAKNATDHVANTN